jgi:amino acid adenylation domain-containing protein
MDYSGLPGGEKLQAIRRYVSEHGEIPFNLQHGPLFRVALLHASQKEDYLFFCTHHIGFDGWSWEVFFSELVQLYDAFHSGKEPSLPALPVRFTDYALWQRKWLSGETLEAYIDHWKNILAGDLPVLEIPTDRPRPAVQSYRGARYFFQLPRNLSTQVKDFCQKERMTKFHLLMAAYAVMLMRYSGQEDIILGCPFANRSRAELDGLVGLFVNTLPIRLNLEGNPVVREFLNQVRTVMLDAITWQAAPFEALVSEISPQRDLSRTPVFQVVINLRNVPKRQAEIEGLQIENIPRENAPSPFDLSLEFDEGNDGTLEASIQYNVDLYDENSIIHLVSHYQNLLGDLLKKADHPMADLEMLTQSEQQRILIDWNDLKADFPQVCVHDLISEQAEKNGEALAVECNGNALTYSELEKKANQLAHYLTANGVEAGARLGIYLPRSEKSIIALLAVLKAGAAYVPLDQTFPKERIAYMVEDSQPAAIITLFHLINQLPGQVRKICLDTESNSIDACENAKPVSTINNDSLVYIIYTSGSTGRPKGAMNIHKGIVNYLTYMKRKHQFSSADRIVQLTSLSFDVSAFEIFNTLTCGGTLYVMDDAQMRDPEYINARMIATQATYISCVPTMLRALCKSALAGERRGNNLRLILPAGEVLRQADVELARKAFGDSVMLVNQYGPTECSIIHTSYVVPSALPNGMQIVPIGKPVDNARAYVLDEYLHPVPPGAKGELFIGGVGVGTGYWNQPDLTAERFLPDPFWLGGKIYRSGDVVRQLPDGTICYLGRSDDQVKIRGYRVELGEIEAVMNEFPGVKDAAVALWRENGMETLAAYISMLEGAQGPVLDNLNTHLKERLPFYMLPTSITIMKELPLTPSRKIDRHALPRPESGVSTNHYLAPRNETETKLVSIWEEILGMEHIGIRDNFFELGGHSLLAVRLFTRIQEEFGQSLPLMLLFQNGTVEATAEALTGEVISNHPQGIIPIQPKGSEFPIFMISAGLYMRDLALALGSARPVYSLNSSENGEVVYRISVQETAKIYYHNLVNFYPHGPYLLLGHSAHGFFTLELARLLIQNGHNVAFLGLLDTYPPGYKRQANLIERLKVYSDNFRDKNFPEILQYFRGSIRRFTTRWLSRAGMEARMIERFENKGQVKEVRNLLLGTYKPEAFDGKVTIFTATHRPQFMKRDPMEQWAHIISGQLEFVPVPGDHMTALQPPNVALLAGIIEKLLPNRENG